MQGLTLGTSRKGKWGNAKVKLGVQHAMRSTLNDSRERRELDLWLLHLRYADKHRVYDYIELMTYILFWILLTFQIDACF